MTPPTVNAYFNPQMNDINFPAGVLQRRFTIPRKMTHPITGIPRDDRTRTDACFRRRGRKFDAKGNLRDWWTPEDAKGFEDRISCVRSQYANYVIVDDIHINSKLTSGEDVADIGGRCWPILHGKSRPRARHLLSRRVYAGSTVLCGMAQWLARTRAGK